MLHEEHPEYVLKIVGDASNEEGTHVVETIKQKAHIYNLKDSIILKPFSPNVHEEILEDAMYVNTSDYEGISNAMLEAMAIGLPVICTDCPVGGAKATIENDINGILVPVGDAESVYNAMKKIIEDKEFARNISKEATNLRDKISLDNIARKWMELL
jgi:glycosyltransferase involved in cell wall biosynthesis